MRIRNPNHAGNVSPVTQQDKDDVNAALVALGANAAPTLAELRAAITAGRRARFTDGMICQTALELGLVVDPE